MTITFEISDALVQSTKMKGYTEEQIIDMLETATEFLLNDLEPSQSINAQNN